MAVSITLLSPGGRPQEISADDEFREALGAYERAATAQRKLFPVTIDGKQQTLTTAHVVRMREL